MTTSHAQPPHTHAAAGHQMPVGGQLSGRRNSGGGGAGGNLRASFCDQLYRTIDVVKDEVGYGFQINGEYPALIEHVRADCPAAIQGLQVGDKLVKIDAEPIIHRSHDEIVRLIRERKKFSLTVLKNTAPSDASLIPSHPIPATPQGEDAARIAGYNVTFAMISAEYRHLDEFHLKLTQEPTEAEKVQLHNQITSSTQIIRNLEKKIPADILTNMKKQAQLPRNATFFESPPRPDDLENMMKTEDDQESLDPVSPEDQERPRRKVERRHSLTTHLQNTQNAAKEVLDSFRTMRSKRVLGHASFQNGSLQNLSSRDFFGKKGRANTSSDSELNKRFSSAESLTNSPSVVSTTGAHLGDPDDRKGGADGSEGKSTYERLFYTKAEITVNFIRMMMTSDRIISDRIINLFHCMLFMRFSDYVLRLEESHSTDRKKRNVLDMFTSHDAPLYIDLPLEVDRRCLDACYKACEEQVRMYECELTSITNFWKVLAAPSKPEKECNELISWVEKQVDLPEARRNAWCCCIVTYMKMKNWKVTNSFSKLVFKNRSGGSQSYQSLFSKKLLDSNKTIRAFSGGHSFQTVRTAAPDIPCHHCKLAISENTQQCTVCSVYVHNECRSHLVPGCVDPSQASPTAVLRRKTSSTKDLSSKRSSIFGGGGSGSKKHDSGTLAEEIDGTPLSPSSSENSQSNSGRDVKRSDSVRSAGPVTRSGGHRRSPSDAKRSSEPNGELIQAAVGPRGSHGGSSHFSHASSSEYFDQGQGSNVSIETQASSASGVSQLSVDSNVASFFNIPNGVRDEHFTASDDFKTLEKVISPQHFQHLAAQNRNEIKRQNILLEFANSERKQTYNLKLLKEVFGQVLLDETHFYRLDLVIDFHFKFYMDLMKCMDGGSMMFGDVGEVLIDVFSSRNYMDIFLKYNTWITSKTESFDSNSLKFIKELEHKHKIVLNKRQLQDIVVTEVQRATKYKLLLEPLKKFSPESDLENISTALQLCAEMTSKVDQEKGYLDQLKKIVSKFDRSAVDNDKSRENELLRKFNFIDNKLLKYGYFEAELKVMAGASRDNKSQVREMKLVRIPKKCFVMFYEEHLIFVEETTENKPILKPQFHKGVPSILPIKDIKQVTPDMTTLYSTDPDDPDDKKQAPALIIVTVSFFLNIFLDSESTLETWGKTLKEKMGHNPNDFCIPKSMTKKCLGSSVNPSAARTPPIVSSSVAAPGGGGDIASSAPPITNPTKFDFTSKVNHSGGGGAAEETDSPAPSYAEAAAASEPERPPEHSDSQVHEESSQPTVDPMVRIQQLRTRVIDLLNESFALARSVYDPENTRSQENLKLAFDCVMSDELNKLLNYELWAAGLRTGSPTSPTNPSIPVSELEGNLSASDLTSTPNVEYFMRDNAPMYEHASVVNHSEYSVSQSDSFTAFSDESPMKNEIHIHTSEAATLDGNCSRLLVKTQLLSHQLSPSSITEEEDEESSEPTSTEPTTESGEVSEESPRTELTQDQVEGLPLEDGSTSRDTPVESTT